MPCDLSREYSVLTLTVKKEQREEVRGVTFALAEFNSSKVHQVHAIQVVIYEELQEVWDVALMRLVSLVHDCPAL